MLSIVECHQYSQITFDYWSSSNVIFSVTIFINIRHQTKLPFSKVIGTPILEIFLLHSMDEWSVVGWKVCISRQPVDPKIFPLMSTKYRFEAFLLFAHEAYSFVFPIWIGWCILGEDRGLFRSHTSQPKKTLNIGIHSTTPRFFDSQWGYIRGNIHHFKAIFKTQT